jgi:hypothetical protein
MRKSSTRKSCKHSQGRVFKIENVGMKATIFIVLVMRLLMFVKRQTEIGKLEDFRSQNVNKLRQSTDKGFVETPKKNAGVDFSRHTWNFYMKAGKHYI